MHFKIARSENVPANICGSTPSHSQQESNRIKSRASKISWGICIEYIPISNMKKNPTHLLIPQMFDLRANGSHALDTMTAIGPAQACHFMFWKSLETVGWPIMSLVVEVGSAYSRNPKLQDSYLRKPLALSINWILVKKNNKETSENSVAWDRRGKDSLPPSPALNSAPVTTTCA